MDAPVALRRSGPAIPKMGVDGQAAVKSYARACSCHRSGRAAWTQWLREAKPSCQPRPDPMASAVLSLVHMGGRKGGAQASGRRLRPAMGTRAGEVAQEQQGRRRGRDGQRRLHLAREGGVYQRRLRRLHPPRARREPASNGFHGAGGSIAGARDLPGRQGIVWRAWTR